MDQEFVFLRAMTSILKCEKLSWNNCIRTFYIQHIGAIYIRKCLIGKVEVICGKWGCSIWLGQDIRLRVKIYEVMAEWVESCGTSNGWRLQF